MANKEKDDDKLTKTTTPVENELNLETLKASAQEKMEHHNKLASEKDRLIVEVNKITEAMTLLRGEFNNCQNLINEFFDTDKPSDNGSA